MGVESGIFHQHFVLRIKPQLFRVDAASSAVMPQSEYDLLDLSRITR